MVGAAGMNKTLVTVGVRPILVEDTAWRMPVGL